MKKQLLLILILFFSLYSNSQTISIVGTGVNGYPPNLIGSEIVLSTTDNIIYTKTNLLLSDGEVKFRENFDWINNWGGTTFPSGQGILNVFGFGIPTQAGIYDVTFNKSNGTYTFIGTPFPKIGIWGPAVNSQLGYTAPDVDMITTDGIMYTLSGFYFSSGNAYFRQDNATSNVWGSTIFPSGTAILNGPSLFIPSNEWFATFNRITGEYSFTYPSIGILGTALDGYLASDTDLSTTDGFNYSVSNLVMTTGTVKFRKDNLWTSNWGSIDFPAGTGTQNGTEIPINISGTYNVSFEKSSGNYSFTNILSNLENSISNVKIYPNPTTAVWNISHRTSIDSIELFDVAGKTIQSFEPNTSQFELDGSALTQGAYFLKIKSGVNFTVQKIIKN
jgi:hypothetical protein